MKYTKPIFSLSLVALSLAGCSVDTESVSQALASEKGWEKTQSDCYAERLAGIMDRKSYNRIADLLSKGATLTDAISSARRTTGKSYTTSIKNDSELQACIAE